MKNILEVVSQHVQLQPRHHHWVGLCPFHSEQTPSFLVNAYDGRFICLGCGAYGDAKLFEEMVNAIH